MTRFLRGARLLIDAIFVVGHFGAPNAGDEAMLVGLVHALRERSSVEIIVSTKSGALPPVVRQMNNVRAVRRGLLRDFVRAARARCVVIGGGTHFHDACRGRRLAHQYLSLIRYCGITLCGALAGGRAVWLGMGVGPMRRRLTRGLYRLGALSTSAIVVRDAGSLSEAHRASPNTRTSLAFDLAALMPLRFSCDGIAAGTTAELIVGFGPASVGADPGGSIFDPLADGLTRLSATRSLRVEIFTFCGSGPDTDQGLVAALSWSWRQQFGLECDRVDLPGDPTELVARIRSCDLFIAGRYHALLLAFLADVPVIAISYHRKVRDLATELGMDQRLVLDMNQLERLSSSQFLMEAVQRKHAQRIISPSEARKRAYLNLEELFAVVPWSEGWT